MGTAIPSAPNAEPEVQGSHLYPVEKRSINSQKEQERGTEPLDRLEELHSFLAFLVLFLRNLGLCMYISTIQEFTKKIIYCISIQVWDLRHLNNYIHNFYI